MSNYESHHAKLTKTYIDSIKLPAPEPDKAKRRHHMHWDKKLKGFGIRASTKKLTYVYHGRIKGPHSKSVAISIGSPPAWTADQARKHAMKLAVDMDKGIDPRAAKRADKEAAITLAEVAAEYTSRPGKLKKRSIKEINRHIQTTFEKWKDKPIASITEDMCRKRYKKILTTGLRGNGPAPGQANQSFSVLRALINFSMRRYKSADGSPLITYNPVGVLKDDWITLPERNARIPESKIGAVWSALNQWREDPFHRIAPASTDLVMFLLLTGARIGEGSSVLWENINLDEQWWHIPDPKNGNPVWLPLSTQAVDLLQTRERVPGCPYVFPNRSNDGYLSGARATLEAVSEIAGTKINAHDLRRTFITYSVANCAVDFHKVELLTNHVPKGVTARHYLETNHLQYLKPEVQAFADWVCEQADITV